MTFTKSRVDDPRSRMEAEYRTLCSLLTEQWGEAVQLHTTMGLSCLIPGVDSMSQTPIHLN